MYSVISVVLVVTSMLNTVSIERKDTQPANTIINQKQVSFEEMLIKSGLNHGDPRYKLLLLDWQKTD